jgi:type II secretory pathway component PulF
MQGRRLNGPPLDAFFRFFLISTNPIRLKRFFSTLVKGRSLFTPEESASNILSAGMSEENLKQRLAYFEQRLEEAKRRHSAKEPHPRTFDAGYTTDTFKTWAESIALINERLATINDQLKAEARKSSPAREDV